MALVRTNRVPDSMSIEIPGFREAQRAWYAEWQRRQSIEERNRAIDAERAAYLRSRYMAPVAPPNGIVTAARIPADTFLGGYAAGRQIYDTVSSQGVGGFVRSVVDNPDPTENPDAGAALGAALAVVPAVPMVKRGFVTAVDRVVASSTMRPGMLALPGRTRFVRPPHGSFFSRGRVDPADIGLAPEIEAGLARSGPAMYAGYGDVLDEGFVQSVQGIRIPQAYTGVWRTPRMGLHTADEVFQRAKKVIVDTYANREARDIVNKAFITGDRSSPVVKMYDAARQDLMNARAELERSAAARSAAFAKRVNSTDVNSAYLVDRRAAEKTLAKSLRAPSLWSEKLAPVLKMSWVAGAVRGLPGAIWRHKAATVGAMGIPMAAFVWLLNREETKKQDGVTDDVIAEKKKFADAYSKFTADADRATAMSDAAGLQTALRGLRDIAVAEIAWKDERAPEVRRRLSETLGSITNSATFADLLSRNQTRYAARALRADDYQREFLETYRDPASQAIEDDFWDKIGGAP